MRERFCDLCLSYTVVIYSIYGKLQAVTKLCIKYLNMSSSVFTIIQVLKYKKVKYLINL